MELFLPIHMSYTCHIGQFAIQQHSSTFGINPYWLSMINLPDYELTEKIKTNHISQHKKLLLGF